VSWPQACAHVFLLQTPYWSLGWSRPQRLAMTDGPLGFAPALTATACARCVSSSTADRRHADRRSESGHGAADEANVVRKGALAPVSCCGRYRRNGKMFAYRNQRTSSPRRALWRMGGKIKRADKALGDVDGKGAVSGDELRRPSGGQAGYTSKT